MDAHRLSELIKLLKVQTNSENEKRMVLYLDKELRKLKLKTNIDAIGNIIVTKGKASTYPCVVSHMDTVHDIVDNFKVYYDINDEDILFAKSGESIVGIGGDDKCGIFACLYLLEIMPEIKVVFFSREECNCKGSKGINKKFFADCRYLIQLDRRGSKDFIQTIWGKKTVSHEFSSEIGLVKKKYKYKNTTGTFTDVMSLWNDKVGVSCINLSCGYYSPHTTSEYISIKDLWHSIQFTKEIIDTMQPKKYVSTPPKPTTVQTTTSHKPILFAPCSKCGVWKKDYLLHKVWDTTNNVYKEICWSCKKENNNEVNTNKSTNSEIVVFACHECGIKTDEMKKGDTLKYRGTGTHLYCNKCAAIFFATKEKNSSVTCGTCDEEIHSTHYRTIIDGMLVCGVCAVELRDYIPKNCWVCNKVIPKDYKVISRFGKPVCEDCAVPSDVVNGTDLLSDYLTRE